MFAPSRVVSGLGSTFKRYLRDTAATTTAIFGIAAIPLFAGAGVAIDMSRANMEKTTFHAALDAAALAVAADDRSSTLGLSESEIATRELELAAIAQDYVDKNHKNSEYSVQITDLNVDISGSEVKLTAEAEFPTTVMGLFGIDTIDLEFESTIKKAMRPIELAMVMDTTGSMNSSGKITGAKNAAKTLLNKLYGGTVSSVPRSEFLRTALIPFSGAVRLNTSNPDFNLSWIDTTGANPLSKVNFNAISSTPAAWNSYYAWSQLKKSSSTYHTWNGCVEARMRGDAAAGTDYNVNDAVPTTTNAATLFPAYFYPDAPRPVSPNYRNYGRDYITGYSTSTSAVGSECAGLSSTVCNSESGTYLYQKQENWRKYANYNIGAESTSVYGPWTNCTASPVVPLTYDRGTVEAGIDAMVATGPTVIPEGLAWGWRVLSPTAPFTQVQGSGSIPGAAISVYDDVRWQKIMVLMTDGDNDVSPSSYSLNGTTYTAYGYQQETLATNRFGTTSGSGIEPALDTAMSTLCTNVKAKNIKVYVAAFGTGISTATKTLLKNCASGPEYYAEATTSAALEAFFDHIGQDVINKSIYVAN